MTKQEYAKFVCYVIGPSRHYDWQGCAWGEALRKCKFDIGRWTKGA